MFGIRLEFVLGRYGSVNHCCPTSVMRVVDCVCNVWLVFLIVTQTRSTFNEGSSSPRYFQICLAIGNPATHPPPKLWAFRGNPLFLCSACSTWKHILDRNWSTWALYSGFPPARGQLHVVWTIKAKLFVTFVGSMLFQACMWLFFYITQTSTFFFLSWPVSKMFQLTLD